MSSLTTVPEEVVGSGPTMDQQVKLDEVQVVVYSSMLDGHPGISCTDAYAYTGMETGISPRSKGNMLGQTSGVPVDLSLLVCFHTDSCPSLP